MKSLNDIVLQIHMTFLSHKDSVDWIVSFKDDISPLSPKEFQNLVSMLEGVSQAEQANFEESIIHNNIPAHLHKRAATTANFNTLIEHLQIEYTRWIN